jgi:hypothetical protein
MQTSSSYQDTKAHTVVLNLVETSEFGPFRGLANHSNHGPILIYSRTWDAEPRQCMERAETHFGTPELGTDNGSNWQTSSL